MKNEYMTPKEVARYDPFGTRKKPAAEDAKELLNETPALEANISNNLLEKAKKILGEDFLGEEAVITMEQRLQTVGADVRFITDPLPPFPYTERDLELAKANGEILVLRTNTMVKNGKEVSIALLDFEELFIKDPFGDPSLHIFEPSMSSWYNTEKFAAIPGEINLEWALVKKEILIDTGNESWVDLETLLEKYKKLLDTQGATNTSVRRRTAMESVWDTYLYYTNRHDFLLKDFVDWGQSQWSNGDYIYIGNFGSHGLVGGHIPAWNPHDPTIDYDRTPMARGVCPTR